MWSWFAVCCSGLLHISAAYRGPRWQFYLFKPLTIVLLMLIVGAHLSVSHYAQWVFVALLLSVVGDVFLMLPKDRFVHGLTSFLFAHLVYIFAFWAQFDGHMVWWLPAMLSGLGVIVFLLLLPNLGRFALPVAFYIAVITQMVWAAGEYWLNTHSLAAGMAFAGAILFMFSDTVLAFARFKGEFRAAQAMVMSSYFVAQALISASVVIAQGG
ncbi:lysoplasmalogenase [Salinivibrio sp. AR640]|uniref:lysoplasmalogenase n=1 Tax=Salinivibrio sp. AR640 TaxID=1909437 RepID=UPI00098612E7|nr:lysoplasmalogenase [Salinivibrio sp. AR640]OOE94740.1 lysoplasmalogenase [Salinivibrio sp. AR640]